MQNKTYSDTEVRKFSKLAQNWWDKDGQMKLLHDFNPIRVEYIISQIQNVKKDKKNIKILDFGCGGGILSEELAKNGFCVTGVDPSIDSIKIAKNRSLVIRETNTDDQNEKSKSNILQKDQLYINAKENIRLNYFHYDDFFQNSTEKYDVIVIFEVVEHIINLQEFFEKLANKAEKNCIFIISTINRNLISLVLVKFGAEILKIVPRGTHEWKKFLKPSEINKYLEKYNFEVSNITGISYNPFNSKFSRSNNIKMNYFLTAIRK